jgi:hypothetical protein
MRKHPRGWTPTEGDMKNTTPFKTCSKCRQTLPATEEWFVSHPTGKHGLSSQCRGCIAAFITVRDADPSEESLSFCGSCKIYYPANDRYFWKSSSRDGNGWMRICKMCAREASRLSQAKARAKRLPV